MASQLSETTEILNMHFVLPAQCKSPEECSVDMLEAFAKSQENQMKPEWITEAKANSLEPQKTDIFVLEEFKGQVFERLQTFKCLIVGPRCILRCFVTGEPIPPGTSPIFTTPMRGLVVCASGFSLEIKEDIRKKVEYMGGIYTRNLRNSVTHLITDSVTSIKYEKATERGIAIFTHEWVSAIWDTNLINYIPATDETFEQYKCSVFMNLVVTLTNLTRNAKTEMKRLIESNGGKCMGPLDGALVKIVITDEYSTQSEKLRYAMKNNIPCVKSEWVRQSVKKGYSLPFNDYLIPEITRNQCSTPDGTRASLDFSTISTIGGDNANNNFVNETISMSLSATPRDPVENLQESQLQYIPILNNIELRTVKNAGPFLDGCNIYLTGFTSQHRDKINKILNVGSATRLDDISDSLTHVLVGDSKKASNELKIVAQKGLHPHILTVDWLVESINLKKPASEAPYLLNGVKNRMSTKTTEPPASPLSKRSLQMLQRPKRPPVPLFNLDKAPPEEPDIVQKYLKKPNIDDTLKINGNNATKITDTTGEQKSLSRQNNSYSTDTSMSETEGFNSQTFAEKIFQLVGFDEEETEILIKHITDRRGRVVPTSYTGIADFGIVPLSGAPFRHTVDEIVTNLYIDDCMDHEALVEIEYFHRPLSIPENAKPLANCVVATSAYLGVERMYLTYLAVTLGATHQDSFARKTNVEKNQKGATHLICAQPEGKKYAAAVKWGLPAVTCEWLKECAAKLRLVDETPYLVGETVAPQREPTSADTSMNPPTPPVVPRKSQLQRTPITPVTPIINKHLSNARSVSETVTSDFKTPQTPYGALIKPNPSPTTRKAYAQYLDGFPDGEEPSAKRRPLSTPVSAVKRQAWRDLMRPMKTADAFNSDQSISANVSAQFDDDSREGAVKMTNATPPINRALEFDEDSTNEITVQLQQMDKALQSSTKKPSSVERRTSVANDKEDNEGHPNFRCVETQAESVGWEDPRTSLCPVFAPKNAYKRKFMISGVRDRSTYITVIENLGGEVSMENYFDSTSTHLICMRPQRNEKMLGSIAAGKWVLHAKYIQACEVAGEFIDEEIYEWGNEKSKGVITDLLTDFELSLANAAHRWRVAVSQGAAGAFQDMVAMLMVPNDKYEQFERFICAGGGEVVQMKPPYNLSPTGKKVTHCFIQLNKVEQPIDWAMLASKGILCFLPQHLNVRLTATEPLNPRDHVIPEFKKYLALLPK